MRLEEILLSIIYSIILLDACVIVQGLQNPRPFKKACEELENDEKFAEVQDPAFNVAVVYEEGPYESSNTSYYGCAGVLIARKFVLTAAHCVNVEIKSIAVIVGIPQTSDINGYIKSVYIQVKQINMHPNYKNGVFSNDIAVLELENEVSNTKEIFPICLTCDTIALDHNTVLFGTGIQRDGDKKLIIDVLLKGDAQIASGEKCNEISRETDNTQLCVMDSEEICESISGSALVMTAKDKKTGKNRQSLVGIKIAGYPCVHSKLKIYTKISAHLEFIENIVWRKND